MTYQYMIWRKEDKTEHLVFHQTSLRVVYPPSSPFYLKPIQTAIMAYEHRDWECIANDAWRGDKIDEYLQAMHKMYPKALPPETKSEQEQKRILSQEDSTGDGVPDAGDPDSEQPS